MAIVVAGVLEYYDAFIIYKKVITLHYIDGADTCFLP